MANDQLVVELKRVGTELRDVRKDLRSLYKRPNQQVASLSARTRVAKVAETWISNYARRAEIRASVSDKYLADLTVHFQRLLTFSEKATLRKRYDSEIKAILEKYTSDLLIPVMRGDGEPRPATAGDVVPAAVDPNSKISNSTAFVGHSFSATDKFIVDSIIDVLDAIGISAVTGTKPKADKISDKVKKLIEQQGFFVGIFTRRDKLSGKSEWTTSTWVIDEKAYAHARDKKLILLVENGVESIGGIQGHYEYLSFDRDRLHEVLSKLLQLFVITVDGLREA